MNDLSDIEPGAVIEMEDGRRLLVKSIRKETPPMRTIRDEDVDAEVAALDKQLAGLEKALDQAVEQYGSDADGLEADETSDDMTSLKAEVEKLGETLIDAAKARDNEFEKLADDIRTDTGCSRTMALAKARTANPGAFRRWERAFSADIAKELQQQGGRPAQDRLTGPPMFGADGCRAANQKFLDAVNAIASRDKVSKLHAMQKARQEHSDLYAEMQKK